MLFLSSPRKLATSLPRIVHLSQDLPSSAKILVANFKLCEQEPDLGERERLVGNDIQACSVHFTARERKTVKIGRRFESGGRETASQNRYKIAETRIARQNNFYRQLVTTIAASSLPPEKTSRCPLCRQRYQRSTDVVIKRDLSMTRTYNPKSVKSSRLLPRTPYLSYYPQKTKPIESRKIRATCPASPSTRTLPLPSLLTECAVHLQPAAPRRARNLSRGKCSGARTASPPMEER